MESKLLLNIEICKQLRRNHGLSQDNLAYACKQRRLPISIATIKRAETGKPVSNRTARELALFYGVELEVLLVVSKSSDSDTSINHGLLTILWLRIDNRDIICEIKDLLKQNNSVWQDQLGNVILAAFNNNEIQGKTHLHAQMILLDIRNLLLELSGFPIHFYAMLQLSLEKNYSDATGLAPDVLQRFAQHSSSIPVDSIVVTSEIYHMSKNHFSYLPYNQADSALWLLQKTKFSKHALPLFTSTNKLKTYNLAIEYEKEKKYFKAANCNYLAATEMLQSNMYSEALEILQKSLSQLATSDHHDKIDLEINIQLALSSIYKVKYGWVSPLLKDSYQRIEKLCKHSASDNRLVMALFGQWTIELATLNFRSAEVIANNCLTAAKQLNDNQGMMLANVALSNTFFWLGKHRDAKQAATKALVLYRPEYYSISIHLLGQDPRVLAGCFGTLSASLLENFEEAELFRKTLLSDARKLQHDFSLAIALQGSTWLDFHLNKPSAVLQQAKELESLSIKMNFPFYRGVAVLFIGWSKHKLGQEPEAAQYVREGYHQWLVSSGDKLAYSLYCIILGEILIDSGYLLDAKDLLKHGTKYAIQQDELCYLPEMYRLFALCFDGSKREKVLQKALFYSRESPLFTSRINLLMHILCN